MIAPEILQAWGESELRENFRRFVRDGLFRGAKKQLETSAVKPQYGNLAVDDISESRSTGPRRPELVVTSRRTEVFQVQTEDRQLMNDFLRKIGMRTR